MHNLMLGPTECGKTTLCMALARGHLARGDGVLVLDPKRQAWPRHERLRVFTDVEPFIAAARRSRRCALFFDDMGTSVGRGRDATPARWAVTEARHWLHCCYLNGQYATQVEPIFRTNCQRCFCFRQGKSDAATLVQTFTNDGFMQATELGRYEFLVGTAFDTVRKCKLKI